MIKPIFKMHRASFIILVSLIFSLILINPASAQTTWHERTAADPIPAGCGAPYALAGDDGAGDYYAWTPANGAHTVTATPYSGPEATGIAGTALSINFTVTQSTPNPEITGPQRAWQTLTMTFLGPQASESDNSPNPFLNYQLQVLFTGSQSQTYNVPGYFAGNGSGSGSGNRWQVRFTPDAGGTWTYQVSFRQGTNVAIDTSPAAGSPTSFDGLSGSLNIAARDSGAPGFLSKGRLVYDNKKYLKSLGDGKYWIKGGTDSPENFLAYAGFDNTIASHDYDQHTGHWTSGDPDWGSGQGRGIIGALNYLASQNVNSIYFLPMNIGGDGQDVWPYSGSINPAGSIGNDNLHFDISKLRQWEIVFTHAEKKGINLHFVLNEAEQANKQELDNGTLGNERKLFYRELVARFGHHNAIQWNLSEEYDLEFNPGVSMIKSWAQYIKSVDPYDHPITVHNAAANAWDPLFGAAEFDLMSYQYHAGKYGDRVEQLANQAQAAGRIIPVGMDEFWNAKNADDESHVTHKHTYLSGHSFLRRNVLWPVYFSGGQVEYILYNTRFNDDFQPYNNLWNYTWYARKFMEDILPSFSEMSPADHLLTGEASGHDEDGQVLTQPGVYAIYLPRANPSGSLNLSGVSGSFRKRWYNPRTGLFEGTAATISGGGNISLGTPPSNSSEDWVVLLEIVSTCGDGNCDTGECTSGCTADCSLSDCCGKEGCNTTTGETCSNCEIDCGSCMVFPGADWIEKTPESQGVDSAKLNQAMSYLASQTGSDNVDEAVVIRNGYMIWKGNDIDNKHAVYSCTKSFSSTVMGLLYDDGKLTPETLAKNHVSSLSVEYPNLRLKHFVTMTSGYDAVGGSKWDNYLDGSDTPWVPTTPWFAPGEAFLYWDDATDMFGHVLTQIAKEPLYNLFKRRIADQIGIPTSSWSWGNFGTVGGYLLNSGSGRRSVEITARQMARFGHLFLNRGNWAGNQLISTDWIDIAMKSTVSTSIPLFKDIYTGPTRGHFDLDFRGIYGFHWYENGITPAGTRSMPDAQLGTFYRTGHNDNYLIIIPEWNMVIVRLGSDETIHGNDADDVFNAMLKIIKGGITVP